MTAVETLPDYLRPGLDIVLVGLNPSIPSAQTGRYFANPRNRFWRAFNAAGLVPEALGPESDYRMLDFGIGMTDVVKRPTAGVGDLTAADFRDGAADLRERLLAASPRIVSFHGVTAAAQYRRHAGGSRDRVALGLQEWRIGESAVFVTPNPSPANASFSLEALTAWYSRLKELRDRLKSA
ncbi:MAG: mismatch-specific DNA-glycosylase [Chloroflexota bacterium]|nr:mismatch-specific DNA-glycosylase [Chloroflexota bacterium]